MRKILILDRNEELAERVRTAIAGLHQQIELVSCTRIGSVDHVHEHDGPFDVLIAGPSLSTRTGLRRVAQLHRQDPVTSIVVCFGARPDASLREIIQAGADDLIESPSDDATMRAVIKRALDIAGGRLRPGRPAQAHQDATPAASPLGRVLTVTSPTGGCGKTFYATNMAYFLAKHTEGRVVLLDLDLQFGEVTTSLRLQPTHTVYDLLLHEEQDDAGELGSYIEDYLVTYDDLFWVLTAPKDPTHADRITPIEVTRIIQTLQKRFDTVVVDTPAALAETVLAAFDLSEHLFVLATLDLPSVRNLGVFLHTLEKLRIPSDNVSLLLNKIESDVGIDVQQIAKLFPQGFRSMLPYAKEVSRSINYGKPVLAAYPGAEVSRKVASGLLQLAPAAPVAPDPSPANDHRTFGRWFRRTRRVEEAART